MYDVSADKIAADVDRWITGRNAERDKENPETAAH